MARGLARVCQVHCTNIATALMTTASDRLRSAMATAITSAPTENVSVTPGNRIFRTDATTAAIRNDAKRSRSSHRQLTNVHKKIAEPSAMMTHRYTDTSLARTL